MKKFVHAIAMKNRQLERVYRLTSKTLRSLKTRGVKETGWLAVRKVRLVQHLMGRRRRARTLGLPLGWPKFQIPTRLELTQQRNWCRREDYRPGVLLILPLSNEPLSALKATVKSIARQYYSHWTLSIIRNSSETNETLSYLDSLAKSDSRIEVLSTRPNQEPSELLNQAIEKSKADYCGIVRTGDRVTADALFHVARALEDAPETDVVYTDEVHVKPGTKQLDGAFFKPSWSPEMLLGYNYIGSLCIIRRSLLNEAGGYRPEYQAAQEWDLLLRLMEAGCNFARAPVLLFAADGFRSGPLGNSARRERCLLSPSSG